MSKLVVSRRDYLVGLAAMGLLGGVGIGTSVSAQGKRVLRLADADIGQADPHRAADFPGAILSFNLYDFLVRPAPGGGFKPSLAESWEISADGKTYDFKIRQDVQFHNGDLLTAEDVVFSFERMTTMKRGFSFLFEIVEKVEAPDSHLVRVTLKEAFSPFLASLIKLAIVNKKLVTANVAAGSFGDHGDFGEAFLSGNDAGCGPYTIVSHNPQSETVFEIFQQYFGGFAENAPEAVHIRYGVEAAAIRQLMPAGEIDLTRIALPPEVISALSKADGVAIGKNTDPDIYQFKLNTQKAPLDDINVRKAVCLAFDYKQFEALLNIGDFSAGTPINGPLPIGAMGYDKDVPVRQQDLDEAKRLLEQSKYAGQPLELDLTWFKSMALQEKFALLLQACLSQIGIKVNISPAPWPQFVEMATKAESTPHITCLSTGLDTTDVDSLMWGEFHSSAAGTYMSMQWMSKPEWDEMLERARQIVDTEERSEIYAKLAGQVLAEYTSLYLYQGSGLVAFRKNVLVPGLVDDQKSVPVTGGNYQFQLMSVS